MKKLILLSLSIISIFVYPAFANFSNEESIVNQSEYIWKIGENDGLSIEFKAGHQEELTFDVSEHQSPDFPGRHLGSKSPITGEKESPYNIVFDLPDHQGENYRLTLDLIYSTGSPELIEISVNGKNGIFSVEYDVKQDANDGEANSLLLTKQCLVVPINGEWVHEENNQITIVPIGVGGMSYDAISFENNENQDVTSIPPHLKPSVYYQYEDGELKGVAHLEIPFESSFENGEAEIEFENERVTTSFDSDGYDFGLLRKKVMVPDLEAAEKITLNVSLDQNSVSIEQQYVPEKKWTLFVTPRVHNDVGFTDLQPHVNELDNRNTDRVLEVLDKYPSYVFNFETSWLVDNYLESRTDYYKNKFLEYSVEGRAPVNALYLNLLTGLSSGEELYRATYYTYKLHRDHGIDFNWASLTDAPSHSWFLPTLLTDVGVKGFVVGSNQTRAPILRFSNLNEESPFYWEGMNGEKIMKWYARSYLHLARLTRVGGWQGPPNLDIMKVNVPQALERYRREDYAPDAIMIYGAYVDNALIPEDADATIIEEWNSEFEYPKLVTASDADFYDYIDENFSNELKTYRGGAGAYWEDGAASTSKATKKVQKAQEMLPMAETAASFSSMLMPRYSYKSELFNDIWKNILFYNEHTWGAFNAISQPEREFVTRQWEIKENYANKADLSTRTVLTRSLNRVSQLFKVEGSTVFAYNWQPWMRSNPVELELNAGEYLFDLEKEIPVEYDVIYEQDGYRKIRFIAGDIPAMGYKGYEIRSADTPPAEKDEFSGSTAENQYYRLTVDTTTGGLIRVYDKESGKEIVDENASYSLNEYLYVSGGEDTKIINHGMGIPPADLQIHKPTDVRIIENSETSVGQRIIVEARSQNTPMIRSEYRLYNDIKRVDIINTVHKDPTLDKEGVYFAFPFMSEDPDVAYQIQNGWLRPNEDQLPGAAREWFTTQNLVRVNNGNYSIAWASPDAPLFTLTDINRGEWPTHLDIENGHVFSYVMNNYWFTNYKASQGGEFTFSYSITSGENMSREELAQFDADIRSPIIGYPLLSTWAAGVEAQDRPLSAEKGRFFSLTDSENLQFVTLKQAEDGDGWILRLLESAGKEGETELSTDLLDIDAAYLANGVEENQRELRVENNVVSIPYQANRYTTIRLVTKSRLFDQ
ncbi:MAG: glycoside hydrolase family 38 C-terminal domain-containing protein [Balneolaceae bacterium]|nr:glycoside hydrolase family 38 C-terminal domain-containing protein [Balneolaceae bacterium]